MTEFVIIDSEGTEHTEPISDKDRANELLERAQREGTLEYSLKRIGRGFN